MLRYASTSTALKWQQCKILVVAGSALVQEPDGHFLLDVGPPKRVLELLEREEVVAVLVGLAHHPLRDQLDLETELDLNP